jgi:hypothetical protein
MQHACSSVQTYKTPHAHTGSSASNLKATAARAAAAGVPGVVLPLSSSSSSSSRGCLQVWFHCWVVSAQVLQQLGT